MNDQERESLQRDLSDALVALQQNKPVATLDGLADHLVKLGSPVSVPCVADPGRHKAKGSRRS